MAVLMSPLVMLMVVLRSMDLVFHNGRERHRLFLLAFLCAPYARALFQIRLEKIHELLGRLGLLHIVADCCTKMVNAPNYSPNATTVTYTCSFATWIVKAALGEGGQSR